MTCIYKCICIYKNIDMQIYESHFWDVVGSWQKVEICGTLCPARISRTSLESQNWQLRKERRKIWQVAIPKKEHNTLEFIFFNWGWFVLMFVFGKIREAKSRFPSRLSLRSVGSWYWSDHLSTTLPQKKTNGWNPIHTKPGRWLFFISFRGDSFRLFCRLDELDRPSTLVAFNPFEKYSRIIPPG